jgi:antitoxin YefM
MKTTSDINLRRNLASALDAVVADREPMIITRGNGKPPVVLVSLEDFASYKETHYLLRSPENATRLSASIRTFDNGKRRARIPKE